MTVEELKQQAAEEAATAVQSGMVVGLGTGSTAVYMVRALGQMVANGRLHNILGIPTSEATAHEAKQVGLPLTTLDTHPIVDITIDGADEISPELDLIKGLGGALLREKIVATASRRMIVVGDGGKKVARLGTRAPLPVEVIPFAQKPVRNHLASLGAQPVLRLRDGTPFITDEGNVIIDCHFATGLPNPAQLAQAIRQQPGVVEHGLFLRMATTAVLATPQGIQVLGQPL
jgi:ribose 5-phosphate isomerase A